MSLSTEMTQSCLHFKRNIPAATQWGRKNIQESSLIVQEEFMLTYTKVVVVKFVGSSLIVDIFQKEAHEGTDRSIDNLFIIMEDEEEWRDTDARK